MSEINLSNIKHIVLVLSGKGGVGKSSVTTQLALGLVQKGFKVGVLDIDLTGPSIPRMLGLDGKQVHQASQGWVPVYADEQQRLSCMSIGFLLSSKNDSVVWRGPKKNAMIKQFLQDVYWGELDYLLIDTPPGTSDEHISIIEYLKSFEPDGAVIVTTPQNVAIADVRKEISFCRKVKLPILGVVENMSGFVCPHCADCTNIFSSGGGESMANEYGIDFFGRVPIDPGFTSMVEAEGDGSYVKSFSKSNLFPVFQGICDKRERISERVWGKWFIILAGVQLLITIPNLIATLVIFHPVGYIATQQEQKYWAYYGYKAVRVQAETIWFILFEVWRFWLAFDGVVQGNSLTVFLTFGSTVFAIALGAMQIAEFKKIDVPTVYLIPDIVMTSILVLLAFPTTYVTYRLYKNCDWIRYKKLGSDVNLHRMYYWVQCYVLAVKINLFFQVLLVVFYAVYVMIFGTDAWIWVFSIGAPILSAAFLLFGRKAIAAESYWMMTTFIAYQLSIVSLNIVMLVWAVQFMIYDIWYFLCAYAGTSVITCLITIFVSIRCLLNFGKGLHPHVQFGWYKLKKDHTVLGARTNSNHIAENMSLDAWAKEEDMYIDPDSSLIASDYGIDEEPNLGYRNRGF